jgi:putative copper export protein
MLLAGASWVGPVVFRRAGDRRMRALAAAGLAGAVAGLGLFVGYQLRASGSGFHALFSSSIGRGLWLRAAPLALCAAGIVVWRRRAGPALVAAGAGGAIFAHSWLGHAAVGRLSTLNVGVQWVHFAAASVWIGGLVALVAGLNQIPGVERARAARAFSAVALYSVALVVASGVGRALAETGSLRLLASSTFGRYEIVKAGLLVVLVALGAVNRYRNAPSVAVDGARSVRGVSKVEIVVAAGVLVATGIMTSVAPGRSILAAQRARAGPGIVVTGTDFATTIRVRLQVTPGPPGPNQFVARVTDADSGSPVASDLVRLTFAYRGRPGVQPTTLTLSARGKGEYAGRGSNLALRGPWRVTVSVQRGPSVVEVGLTLVPIVQEQIQVIPGTPTLYTVGLGGSDSVQFYVDPGRAGRNEVHATYFSGAGEFTGLTGFVAVGTPPGGGDVLNFPTRSLGPGHIVADATLQTGRWRFDVSAVTRDGRTLYGSFEQQIT